MAPGGCAEHLLMTLEVAIVAPDLETAGDPIRDTLNVPLRPGDDLELGGRYLAYEPGAVPERGVASVRVLAHELDGDAADDSMRLPYTARVELVGSDLLELGRIARTLVRAKPGNVGVLGYVVAPQRPTDARELWRAHSVNFSSSHAAEPLRSVGAATPLDELQSPSGRPSPALECQLTMTISTESAATAAKLVAGPLRAAFEFINDPDLGGCAAEYSDARWSLLVRPNALDPWSQLHPGASPSAILLDVTFRTQSLLDLGYVAAQLREDVECPCESVAYRAAGDLVRDRVPRLLAVELDGQPPIAAESPTEGR
jgi:hypothetical protein